MAERELEERMHAFLAGDADVLVSTTIIESGIDIPQANTLIVERADALGLAQLYQIRGRVGRSDVLAYAYLSIPMPPSTPEARAPSLRSRITRSSVRGSRARARPRDPWRRATCRAGAVLARGRARVRAVVEMLDEAVAELTGGNAPGPPVPRRRARGCVRFRRRTSRRKH